MEACLIGLKPMLHADRARVPRAASELHAILSGCASEMTGAGRDVIALDGEGADGARAEAWLRRARIARARSLDAIRKSETLGEGERAPVTVPEAPVWMDQHAQSRAMYR